MFNRFRNRTVGIQPPADPVPNPLQLRLRHIDADLTRLAGGPRTENWRVSVDYLLDKRLELRPAPAEQVTP